MARADVPEWERRDFSLYIDEFHSFASDSFAAILSEARKYRLSLTLSHQYLRQLKPGIADAVMGNVGSFAAFRVGHEDAQALEQAFGKTYSSSAFSNLSNGEAYAKMLSGGRDIEPCLVRTMPPQGKRYGRRAAIISRSRERYSTSRQVIEQKIGGWFGVN